MYKIIKLIISCFLFQYNWAARHPASPCTNVFSFEGEPESDRWYGVISFSSNVELAGLNYKVQLDKPSQLLVSWDGEVRSDDNIVFNVFNPYHTQRPGEVVNARIMVKFNPPNGVPNIAKITINGNTMCSTIDGGYQGGINPGIGLSGETSTSERYDPSFNENEDSQPDYPNNNRDPSNNFGYAGNNPTYTGANPFNTGNNNRPSNVPNYGNNQQTNFGNPNNQYAGSNMPNYEYNNPSRPNYNSYDVIQQPSPPITQQSGYGNNPPTAQAGYGNNLPPSAQGYGNNRPQWQQQPQENQTSIWQNNVANGYPSNSNINQQPIDPNLNSVNPQNSGPVVTTLTLPNNMQNKSNIDQIVQIIKNQLDQQQFSANSNRTVIVAVVNPVVTSPPVQQQQQPQSPNNVVLVTPEPSPTPQYFKTSTSTTASTVSSHASRTKGTTNLPSVTKSATRSSGNGGKRSGEREREED